jgi:hypothetical protein
MTPAFMTLSHDQIRPALGNPSGVFGVPGYPQDLHAGCVSVFNHKTRISKARAK